MFELSGVNIYVNMCLSSLALGSKEEREVGRVDWKILLAYFCRGYWGLPSSTQEAWGLLWPFSANENLRSEDVELLDPCGVIPTMLEGPPGSSQKFSRDHMVLGLNPSLYILGMCSSPLSCLPGPIFFKSFGGSLLI